MANPSDTEKQSTEKQAATEIDQGNYELIRNRLLVQGKELGEKAEALNQKRQEVFGSTVTSIIGNERIRTEHNCVPRDIVAAGDKLLLGYNVYIGLKKHTSVSDVFSVHRFDKTEEGYDLSAVPEEELTFLRDPTFVRDFEELYRYYKDTRLQHLQRTDVKVLAVFNTSETSRDIKVFRWNIETDGSFAYIDNRGEGDYVFPPSHDFEWTPTAREQHVQGRFPHISINDEVFVETTGGDLTIKVENNTEAGEGIYAEPVDDAHQALDDADISYAKVGVLILLRIRPYREESYRYLVFNTRNQDVQRLDAIGLSCLELPNDHGIIFPGGYYLNSGDTKTFATDVDDLIFESVIRAPNGEDVLYVFYQKDDGKNVLLPYNMIRKEVQKPIVCHGFSLSEDGRMVVFRADSDEPTRVHPMQIWQTPFMSDEFAATAPKIQSFLGKVGNPDLVRGISDAHSIRRMVENQTPTLQTYEDLIAAINRTIDSYHWLEHEEVGNLLETLKNILGTAEKVIDEFEKVIAIKKRSEGALKEAEKRQSELRSATRPGSWTEVAPFVTALGDWRTQMGSLYALREMRYISQERIDALEKESKEQFASLTDATVKFLTDETALEPYKKEIASLHEQVDEAKKTKDMLPIKEEVETLGGNFDLLTEIVSGLKIDDPTVRTVILERVSEVYALLNRTKAHLDRSYKEILSRESVAQFGVEFKVFSQGVTNAMAMADTPERCDDQLSKLLVQLEELEARYGEFDEFLSELATKREEVYEALESKKRSLLDERQRRAHNMMKAADRILQGIVRRAGNFKTPDELNTYFVADPMVNKARDIAEQLRDLGEGMRADELMGRLKAAKQESSRSQRDKADIFEDDAAVIKLGRHRFTVNTQTLELTMLPRDEAMTLHLTGTDFFEAIEDEALEATRPYWEQQLVSENERVYRSEFLAARMLFDAEEGANGLDHGLLLECLESGGTLERVRKYAATRYDEGYERGVHDADAAKILEELVRLRSTAGLLRFAPRPRAYAALFHAYFTGEDLRKRWRIRAKSFRRLRHSFRHSPALANFSLELAAAIRAFLEQQGLEVEEADCQWAGAYLIEELMDDTPAFVVSGEARALRTAFLDQLDRDDNQVAFLSDIKELEGDTGRLRESRRGPAESLPCEGNLAERYGLALAWLEAFLEQTEDEDLRRLEPVIPETAALFLTEGRLEREDSNALGSAEVTGLLGQHANIEKRSLRLRLDEFLSRLGDFIQREVPGYTRFRALRHEVLEREKERLRLEEFQPRVLSSFVRNKLINDVYLPLIGDNLAKQLGALGDAKRTDLMGMLLLISPPGYGKTTLMEYIANRLGLIFMKINGPALGHGVGSLDPSEAPNATARQEVEKLNLGLEMGNNVMLYVDDIQHTNPEFLQKFISLCDAQRKIEGVWKGRTRTYDLRGKRFCVVMAGNPYTESGEKFQIPDMLANRADTYNLGDILEGKDDSFALSYIENALTSAPVLAPLAGRETQDIYLLIRMARGEEVQRSDLSYDYSRAELDEILSVFQKLDVIKEILLKVNQQYIASASQADEYRTEPPFKLQGSYRNMNKMAEKVVAAMNEEELESLIDDHYTGEAQTLTTGAEQNLLKLAELRGKMSEIQADRWKEIKKTFNQRQMMGGDDDPATRIMAPLSALVQEVRDVRVTLDDPIRNELVAKVDVLGQQLLQAREGMRSSMAEDLKAPLAQLIQQLQEARAGMRSSMAEDLKAPLAQLIQQLQEARAGMRSSMAEDLKAPLAQLAQQLQEGRAGLDQSMKAELSAPLRALVAQLEKGQAELSEAVHDELNVPFQHLLKLTLKGQGEWQQSMREHLNVPLATLSQQLEKGQASLHGALHEELNTPLGLLTQMLEGGQAALRKSVHGDIGETLHALVGQLESGQAALDKSVQGGVGAPIQALTQQLKAGQDSLGKSVQGGVGAPIQALTQQLKAGQDSLGKSVQGGVGAPIHALTQQLKAGQDSLGKSVQGGVGAPIHALTQQIKAGQDTFDKSVQGAVGAPLHEVATELQTGREGLKQTLHLELAELLKAMASQSQQARAALTQTAHAELRIPLEALAAQLKQDQEGLQKAMDKGLHQALLTVAQQLKLTREGLGKSISTDLLKGLLALAKRLDSDNAELRASLDDKLGAKLSDLSEKVEKSGQTLTLNMTRGMNAHTKAVGGQLASIHDALTSDDSNQELVTQLAQLTGEVKEIHTGTQKQLYRPLVALTQQADAIRRGLDEALGKKLFERLDALNNELAALKTAAEARKTGADDVEGKTEDVSMTGSNIERHLNAVAREIEELRYTIHSAIHVAMPELKDKLQSMRSLGGKQET